MKKIKHIVAAIIRGAIILTPGAVFLWWSWSKVSALIAILAALGCEFVTCVIIAYIAAVAAQIKAHHDMKKEAAEEISD